MEAQRNWIISSIIALFGFIFLLQIAGCRNNNSKANIGIGNSIFNQYCSSCHGLKDGGFNNAPGLITLDNYDSLTLLKKLRQIGDDSLHGSYLKSINYSNREVTSIYQYIKNYFKPHY
jgi:mono/diheme cytochrome c family protein